MGAMMAVSTGSRGKPKIDTPIAKRLSFGVGSIFTVVLGIITLLPSMLFAAQSN